jgi:2-polyprenyl-3-methyl-5-hydroxy-6-metoxy-1,4-benzoquinol methylase
MDDETRLKFYEDEGKAYIDQAVGEFGRPYIDKPYRLDMPRYQFATKHFIDANLVRLQDKPALRNPRLKVLDIGAQNGAFSLGWVTMGFDVTAIDVSRDYLQVAHDSINEFACHKSWRTIFTDIIGDISALEQLAPFDCIAALEVVEHLPHLSLFLDNVTKLTKPGARLVINVPGGDSWHTDPGHLLSFWHGSYVKMFPEQDKRVHHTIPDCFKHQSWDIVDFERHNWNSNDYWYATALVRK